jgi:hypothetical protein
MSSYFKFILRRKIKMRTILGVGLVAMLISCSCTKDDVNLVDSDYLVNKATETSSNGLDSESNLDGYHSNKEGSSERDYSDYDLDLSFPFCCKRKFPEAKSSIGPPLPSGYVPP